MTPSILVCSDDRELARELVGEARKIADEAGGDVSLSLLFEADSDELSEIARGADVVYERQTNFSDPSACADLLAAAISVSEAHLVLVGGTKMGMEIAPRAVERASISYAPWAVRLEMDGAGGVSAACARYAGMAVAQLRFPSGTVLATVAPGAFEAVQFADRSFRTETLDYEVRPSSMTVVGESPKAKGGAGLLQARTVVDVGQGVRELCDLDMIRELADALQAELGCSRPVSSERDWLPEWIGLSGAKVKPELCLTLGISGAIQHAVGIRDARIVAAVNVDKEAAIFTQADIGVVADLYEFIPALLQRMRARGARLAWT